MEKGFIYVLRCADNSLYIGSTRDINTRIHAHNKGKVKTTKKNRPFKFIYSEEFKNYSEARKRELYLKTGTGRDWLKKKLDNFS